MTINNINNVNKPQIESQKLAQQQVQNQGQANVASGNQTQAASQAPRQDSVSLTQSAQQLSQAQKKGGEAAPVNQEKIDRIKKAIANDEYRVNPQVLAEKMSKFESELFGQKV